MWIHVGKKSLRQSKVNAKIEVLPKNANIITTTDLIVLVPFQVASGCLFQFVPQDFFTIVKRLFLLFKA